MTAVDGGNQAVLFVTNVLNGTVAANGKNVQRGTVVRIKLRIPSGNTPVVTSNRVIANGFTEHTDPNALVVGPTGVGLGSRGTLYVADSSNNRIAAIPNALTRVQVHWRDLCGCRDDAKGVAGGVNAAVFLGEVEGPVLVEVAIGDQRAECQDRLGAGEAPAGAGDVHAVFDEVAAGAFDHAGRDR